MMLICCAGPPKEEVVQGQGYEFPTIPSSFPIRQRYQEPSSRAIIKKKKEKERIFGQNLDGIR